MIVCSIRQDDSHSDGQTETENKHVFDRETTSDVNKDWTHKDKDKDLTYKDSKQKKKTSITLVF